MGTRGDYGKLRDTRGYKGYLVGYKGYLVVLRHIWEY